MIGKRLFDRVMCTEEFSPLYTRNQEANVTGKQVAKAWKENMRNAQFIDVIREFGISGNPILGICLGMQLMGTNSSEDGDTPGLGLIKSAVEQFTLQEIGTNKIPHIGFDLVHSQPDSNLFKGLQRAADFYFVHSYRMLPVNLVGKQAKCDYGVEFLAAYEQDNIFAAQFHPERSGKIGLKTLETFMRMK
jgi:glutamine amidotransferase